MNRKYLAAIAAVLAMTAVFSACGEAETVTDGQGKTYAYMTDKNNEILQNENGDMVVAVTDADGKEIKGEDGEVVTEAVEYPGVLEMDGYAHNKYIKVEIPDDWKQIGKLTAIMLDNDKNDAQFTIQIKKRTADDSESMWMTQFDQEKKSELVDDFSVKKKEVELGGKKMIKISREYTLKEKDSQGKTGQILDVYIVPVGDETLEYTGVITPENKGKVDFDKIVSEIIYK